MTLQQAIQKNRVRVARYKRAERVLRQVRLHVYDYEDAGLGEKAQRVIATCKRILAPFWQAQTEAVQKLQTDRLMRLWE